jgi:hypothetical protein
LKAPPPAERGAELELGSQVESSELIGGDYPRRHPVQRGLGLIDNHYCLGAVLP